MKTATVGFSVEVEANSAAAPPDLRALPAARPYRLQRALDWVVLIACSPVLVPVGLIIGKALRVFAGDQPRGANIRLV